MAALTVQTITDSGITPSYTSIEDTSNYFVNSGSEFLSLRLNTGAESVTITFTAQVLEVDTQAYGKLTRSNIVISLAGGDEKWVGPFPVGAFSNAEGQVTFTTSPAIDGVSVGVFQFIGA